MMNNKMNLRKIDKANKSPNKKKILKKSNK